MSYVKSAAIVAVCSISLAATPVAARAQMAKDKIGVANAEALLNAESKAIEKLGRDPVIVAAVRAQNAKKATLAEIQEVDRAWMANSGVDARMKQLMSNSCAEHLKSFLEAHPAYSESFAMDNQGANVCMTDKTSDYWQGDEAKWQKSFAGGKGAVFVDKAKYDTSAKALLAQISVPVMDGGVAIGAITVGVNLKQLEASKK
jgi:hypothetical protein